jgi:hypothetical protein
LEQLPDIVVATTPPPKSKKIVVPKVVLSLNSSLNGINNPVDLSKSPSDFEEDLDVSAGPQLKATESSSAFFLTQGCLVIFTILISYLVDLEEDKDNEKNGDFSLLFQHDV